MAAGQELIFFRGLPFKARDLSTRTWGRKNWTVHRAVWWSTGLLLSLLRYAKAIHRRLTGMVLFGSNFFPTNNFPTNNIQIFNHCYIVVGLTGTHPYLLGKSRRSLRPYLKLLWSLLPMAVGYYHPWRSDVWNHTMNGTGKITTVPWCIGFVAFWFFPTNFLA